jgi:hypothetical protein
MPTADDAKRFFARLAENRARPLPVDSTGIRQVYGGCVVGCDYAVTGRHARRAGRVLCEVSTRDERQGRQPAMTELPDFKLLMLAGQTGLPYEALVEASEAEARAQHENTWRIADTTVHTSVLAWRKHRADGCDVRDCAGPEWEHLVGSLTFEQLALAFGAATQMLTEHTPVFTKEELRAAAVARRPDTGGHPAGSVGHVRAVTARVVERARAILAARAAERFPDGVTPGDATVPAGDVQFDGEECRRAEWCVVKGEHDALACSYVQA